MVPLIVIKGCYNVWLRVRKKKDHNRLLGKLYNLRTIVERKNSNEVVGYHRSKTSTRGSEWAKIYVSIGNIAALLTALTAFKVGRHDLIRAPSAFRRLNI